MCCVKFVTDRDHVVFTIDDNKNKDEERGSKVERSKKIKNTVNCRVMVNGSVGLEL